MALEGAADNRRTLDFTSALDSLGRLELHPRECSAVLPKITAVVGTGAIVYAFTSSPSWNFKPKIDTIAPSHARPWTGHPD